MSKGEDQLRAVLHLRNGLAGLGERAVIYGNQEERGIVCELAGSMLLHVIHDLRIALLQRFILRPGNKSRQPIVTELLAGIVGGLADTIRVEQKSVARREH